MQDLPCCYIPADDITCLKLQSEAIDGIEDLGRVVNNILATYPEVSSRCIQSSLAMLTDSSKCKVLFYCVRHLLYDIV